MMLKVIEKILNQYCQHIYNLSTKDLSKPAKEKLADFLSNLGSNISLRTPILEQKNILDKVIGGLKKIGSRTSQIGTTVPLQTTITKEVDILFIDPQMCV